MYLDDLFATDVVSCHQLCSLFVLFVVYENVLTFTCCIISTFFRYSNGCSTTNCTVGATDLGAIDNQVFVIHVMYT